MVTDKISSECSAKVIYEKRGAGEIPTFETRHEAHGSVDKRKRYLQIIECLKECPEMTAKEIAVMMMKKGYIPTSERNFTAPRLTEMSQHGVVEPIGKKVCTYTGKTVAVYALRGIYGIKGGIISGRI